MKAPLARTRGRRWQRSGLAMVVLTSVCMLWPASAQAGRFDLNLAGLGEYIWSRHPSPLAANAYQRDNRWFKSLAGEIALGVAQRFVGPAKTPGALGFEVDYFVTLTNINESTKYWKFATSPPLNQDARENPSAPPGVMTNMGIQFWKGLPFSLAIGGYVAGILDSDMLNLGASLKWAIQEGHKYVPDISISANAGTVLGSHDLSMLVVGGDFVVSKTFGLGGLFTLSPYLGYSFTYARADTHPLVLPNREPDASCTGVTSPAGTDNPCSPADVTASGETIPAAKVQGDEFANFVLGPENIFKHRAMIGLAITATVVTAGFEAGLTSGVQNYSFKLGVDF